MEERFGKDHSDNIASRGSITFMHSHFLRSRHQGRDDNKHIIHYRRKNKRKRKQKKQPRHPAHFGQTVVKVVQGREGVAQLHTGLF